MSPAPEDKGQTDRVLIARAQAGDTDAFAALYDRHAERAFRVARAICRDLGSAEDVVREGFLAIWRDRASYRPELGSFQACAMRVVQGRAIASSRRATTTPPPQVGEPGGREGLLASLRLLPEAQVEVIVLSFYGELSHSEIAAQLDLPAATVEGRMRLGLGKLRDQMDPADDRAVGRQVVGPRDR